jgi:hypothetical protein
LRSIAVGVRASVSPRIIRLLRDRAPRR